MMSTFFSSFLDSFIIRKPWCKLVETGYPSTGQLILLQANDVRQCNASSPRLSLLCLRNTTRRWITVRSNSTKQVLSAGRKQYRLSTTCHSYSGSFINIILFQHNIKAKQQFAQPLWLPLFESSSTCHTLKMCTRMCTKRRLLCTSPVYNVVLQYDPSQTTLLYIVLLTLEAVIFILNNKQAEGYYNNFLRQFDVLQTPTTFGDALHALFAFLITYLITLH